MTSQQFAGVAIAACAATRRLPPRVRNTIGVCRALLCAMPQKTLANGLDEQLTTDVLAAKLNSHAAAERHESKNVLGAFFVRRRRSPETGGD